MGKMFYIHIMKKFLIIPAVLCVFSSYANTGEDSSQYYFSKGLENKTAKKFLVASQHFEKAISFNKSFIAAYVENGYVNLEMRKTDQAKLNFTKAYELQPSNANVLKELTTLYFDFRQWDKAIEFASKCTACETADLIIGMSSYEKEDYGKAETALLRAVAKSPSDAKAQYTLARTYVEMESYRKAIPFFEKAVTLSPEKNVWLNELGLVYYHTDDYKNAARVFQNAVAQGYPQSNDFNENYGYALLHSGNYAKGEEKLMGIYEKKPGNKEILRDLAQLLYDQKQYDHSLIYCQKLMEANPKDGAALYQAGLNFIKMGQKEKGQGLCDNGIVLDPSLRSKKTKVEMGF